ncbi:MAG: hypothetical protein L3K17_05790 [Thermoplasmata archaeon]|nr:hypothetical protein [Thermoplasmata archaeon]
MSKAVKADPALRLLASTVVGLTFLLSGIPLGSSLAAPASPTLVGHAAATDPPVIREASSSDSAPLSSASAATWASWNSTGAPPGLERAPMTYDAPNHEMVLFSGATWTYANGSWTEVCSGSSSDPRCAPEPPAASYLPMAYDAADGYVLLGDDGETWSFAHGAWDERAVNLSFSAEYGGE